MKDYLGYKDKICVVTGAASGIGRATAELLINLGAKVYAIDIIEVEIPGIKNFIQADLCSKDAIDMAFEEIPKQIDCFFGVAGVTGVRTNYYTTFTINYIANKYITENYLKNRMDRGGSICFVTSLCGKHWNKYFMEFRDFTHAKTWNEMINALHKFAKEDTIGVMAYPFSKRALTYYMAEQAIELGRRGIRVNALLPGATDTDTVYDYAIMLGGVKNIFDDSGIIGKLATVEEVAEPLVFLNSDMARFISGYPMIVDYGYDTLVNLGLRKDRTKMRLGSKLYKLGFVQKLVNKKIDRNALTGADEIRLYSMHSNVNDIVKAVKHGENTAEILESVETDDLETISDEEVL